MLRNKQLRLFVAYATLACCLEIDKFLGPYSVFTLFDVFQTTAVHHSNAGYLFARYGAYSWDPMLFSGVPSLLAGIHPWGMRSAMLLIMPPWLMQTIMNLLLLSLGGYGLYRLFLEYFYCSRISSHTLAVCCTLLSTGFTGIVAGPYLFPIIFMWLRDISLGKGSLGSRVGKAFTAALLSTATICVFIIPYFIPFAFVLALGLPDGKEHQKHFILANILFWTGYIAYYSPVIWNLFDFLPNVYRPSIPNYASFLPALQSFIVAFVRQFSTVLGVVCLASFALLKGTRRQKTIFFLFLVLLLVVAITQSQFYELLRGTILHKGHLYRIGLLMPVAGATVAATTIDYYKRRSKTLLFIAPFSGLFWIFNNEESAVFYTLLLLALLLMHQASISSKQIPKLRTDLCLAAMCLLTFFSVMQIKQINLLQEDATDFYATGYGNHKSLKLLEQKSRNEVFRVASVDVHPSIAKSYNLEAIDGKDELVYHNYSLAIAEVRAKQYSTRQASRNAIESDQLLLFINHLPRHKYAIHHTYNRSEPRSIDDFNMPLLLSMNVRFLISSKPIEGIERYGKLWRKDNSYGLPAPLNKTFLNQNYTLPLWIYELNAFPRAFFVPKLVQKSNTNAVFHAISELSVDDMKRQAFVEKGHNYALPHSELKGAPPSVAIKEYSPDLIKLSCTTQTPGCIVVSNNFDPKWIATLNGEDVLPMLRVNGFMQGILLQKKGHFELTLRHNAPIFWKFQMVSPLGLVLMLTTFLVGGFAHRNAPAPSPEEFLTKSPARFHWMWPIGMLALWFFLAYFFKFRRADEVKVVIYACWAAPLTATAVLWWIRKGIRNLMSK